MKLKNLFALLALFICQFSIAQKIAENFKLNFYSENFDSSKTDWTIVANNDNLFIIQDGEYILNRKTNLSPFAIVYSKPLDLRGYKIVTSLKLDRTMATDGSIGLMFAAQENNAAGFLLEFNFNKEFRIRKFSANTYTYVTGNDKNAGWIKNNFINEATVPTLIELRALGNDYDLFFNNKFVQSFSDPEIAAGTCGFVIGPGTKGRVDFIYVFTDEKYIVKEKPDAIEASDPKNDMTIMATAIMEQKTKINQLSEENDLLKRTLDAMKNEKQQESEEKKLMLAKLASHDAEMLAAQKRYDSLLSVNKDLQKYKEMVAGNENSDLIISLSKALKLKSEENEQLKKQNKQLADSLQKFVKPIQPKEQPKQNDGISLPPSNNTPNTPQGNSQTPGTIPNTPKEPK